MSAPGGEPTFFKRSVIEGFPAVREPFKKTICGKRQSWLVMVGMGADRIDGVYHRGQNLGLSLLGGGAYLMEQSALVRADIVGFQAVQRIGCHIQPACPAGAYIRHSGQQAV